MKSWKHRWHILWIVCLFAAGPVEAAHMATGFKVGEVTQTSAIIWTRVTAHSERNHDGVREPRKREPRQAEYVPYETAIADREGAAPGAPGQVRVGYNVASKGDLSTGWAYTNWVIVKEANDYTHQFHLKYLKPGITYALVVEARDGADSETTAKMDGTFTTPVEKDQWQDVAFGVITGQSYWDLDHKDGFHIYPAMRKVGVDFLVPTGDTVYMDSEAPRARTVELARFHWHRMYSLPRHVEFHRHVPGYWEVDDHDSWVNDCWPTMTAKWMNPLTFTEGFDVYREQVPMGQKTYRTIRWGQGLQIWLVEGRLYRSPNNMPNGPEKTIWGKEQLAWLKKSILESDATFRVLVSPTPIVGPDRSGKADNHANRAFAYEGNHFRQWTKENDLKNFFVCCGDRHWQYMSVDTETKLREFCCGPASDKHAGGTPGHDMKIQPFHLVKGGFLSVSVFKKEGAPTIRFVHHDVHGKPVNQFETE